MHRSSFSLLLAEDQNDPVAPHIVSAWVNQQTSLESSQVKAMFGECRINRWFLISQHDVHGEWSVSLRRRCWRSGRSLARQSQGGQREVTSNLGPSDEIWFGAAGWKLHVCVSVSVMDPTISQQRFEWRLQLWQRQNCPDYSFGSLTEMSYNHTEKRKRFCVSALSEMDEPWRRLWVLHDIRL